MALWVTVRNALERSVPSPASGAALHWKHFFCGGLAGVAVQIPTFPFDTLKKRLQTSDAPRTVLNEARVLLTEGGIPRFYRGFPVKCAFVALNGAIFNTVYVAVRRLLQIA
uniref:ADP,ATP carrier protein n=1 Tax=Haptolina brevifila TaxID=156173 RepID=A0A7S2HHU2_9EUKA|mmetsp:Transcript_5454/g.11434  ORF Transcript_5454/g.11434 Transcript_5454/m.11434 type:complete len:111 (+) Transcript_5454:425-757(+)